MTTVKRKEFCINPFFLKLKSCLRAQARTCCKQSRQRFAQRETSRTRGIYSRKHFLVAYQYLFYRDI